MSATRADHAGVIVGCPACGRANRLPYPHIGRTTRCGECRADLAAPSSPIEIADSATFDAAVQQSVLPVIVDFWAPWCGPCRMVAPELERVAAQTSGQFLVVKVNTDQLTDVAARFRIRSIPTLGILHRGREIDRVAGARSAGDIIQFARQAVSADHPRAS